MNPDRSAIAAAKPAVLAMLGGRAPAKGFAQWEAAAELSAEHRLEPLLAWRAETGGWSVPAPIADRWHEARRLATYNALAQVAGLRLAFDRLESAGIPAVALKGVALAWESYPEPALRPMRDIDLLVPEARALEAFGVLSEAGFLAEAAPPTVLAAALRDDHQLPAMDHRKLGVTIELHHRLTDLPARHGYRTPQLATDAVFGSARDVACSGFAAPCPAPDELAAHLIVHAIYGHRLDCGPLVLADLFFLGPKVAWPAVRARAAKDGWLRGADLLLALVERHFGTALADHDAPPADVLDAAAAALLGDPLTRDHTGAAADFAAARAPGARARTLLRRLAPDPEVVACEADGWPLVAYWPVWAVRRTLRLARRVADPRAGDEARAAGTLMRWVEGG